MSPNGLPISLTPFTFLLMTLTPVTLHIYHPQAQHLPTYSLPSHLSPLTHSSPSHLSPSHPLITLTPHTLSLTRHLTPFVYSSPSQHSHRPTQRELLALNKRIIIFSDRAQNEDIFPDFTLPKWDLDTVKYFTVAPDCGSYQSDQWYIVGGESQVVGPICQSHNFPV